MTDRELKLKSLVAQMIYLRDCGFHNEQGTLFGASEDVRIVASAIQELAELLDVPQDKQPPASEGNEALVQALRPFAMMAECFDEDDVAVTRSNFERGLDYMLTGADFHRAARALQDK